MFGSSLSGGNTTMTTLEHARLSDHRRHAASAPARSRTAWGARPRFVVALRGLLAATAATVVIAALLVPSSSARAEGNPADPTNPAAPATVTADLLPTPQIGDGSLGKKGDTTTTGVVWDQLVVGNTVFVGGAFAKARPAGSGVGQNVVARNHMLAYDLKTGKLLSFAPSFNAPVNALAVSADGKTLFVAGEFTKVDGAARSYVAAFDVASGALVSSFAPVINKAVKSIAVTSKAVYLGGNFTAVQKTTRGRAAAVVPGTGALLSWDPKLAGGEVKAMVVAGGGSRVVLGGRFTTANGKDSLGLASVTTDTAVAQPWAVGSVIRNGEDILDEETGKMRSSGIYSLAAAGDSVYGTGWAYGTGNFEGSFKVRASDGAIEWLEDCRGDAYSVQPVGDVVYTASHHHDCSNVGGFGDNTAPEGQYRGLAFTNAATGKNLAANTTFWSHAGQPAPSLLHWFPSFDTGLFTGSNQGPWDVTAGGGYVLYGGEFRSVNGTKQTGLARFATSSVAPDTSGPRFSGSKLTVTADGFEGTGVKLSWPANDDRDSSRLRYQVIRDGNTAKPVFETSWIDSTFWERPTVRAVDSGLTAGTTSTYQVRSIDPDGNSTLSAAASYTASAGSPGTMTDYDREILEDRPEAYWPFNETSGASAFDWAGSNDLSFVSGRADGIEEATGGRAGDFDGTTQYVAQETSVSAPVEYSAEAWFSTTSTSGGQILGFAHTRDATNNAHDRHVYLTDAGRIVFGVWTDSARTVTSPGSYNDGRWHHVVTTLGRSGLQLFVDGALVGSRAEETPAGVFEGYWNVGGNTLAGWTSAPSSDFLNGAIDNVALYSSVLPAGTVAAHYAAAPQPEPSKNEAPTASFTAVAEGLAARFDASASSDPDGSVVSYSWAFGDGATGTGRTATHTYAKAGTYTSTLTVTDDDGQASTAATRSITVVADPEPPSSVIAADGFERSIASGWGSAETGGAWTVSQSNAGVSVGSGSGKFRLAPSEQRMATLPAVAETATDTRMSFTLDQAAGTSSHYVSVIGRGVGSERYTARVIVESGKTRLEVQANGKTLTSVNLSSTPYAAGQTVSIRFEVTGTGTTTLRAKAWIGGGTEPAAWQITRTDTTAGLQKAGTVGLIYYAGRPNTTTISISDYGVTRAG